MWGTVYQGVDRQETGMLSRWYPRDMKVDTDENNGMWKRGGRT